MAIVYPRTTHREAHFTGSATVRDVVIGMSDGLTVPFALAAGLSGAVNSSFIVLVAGVAEMAAGSMAMGLGGYLAARSEADSYRSELARERAEVRDVPEVEAQEVRDIFRRYGLEGSGLESAVQAVRSSPEGWVRFMMREELGLEEPDPKRAPRSAFTIGLSYIAGGLLPLAPYALGLSLTMAFLWSIGVTLLALLAFGAVKARFTGVPMLRGALQTVVVGGVAAGVAYGPIGRTQLELVRQPGDAAVDGVRMSAGGVGSWIEVRSKQLSRDMWVVPERSGVSREQHWPRRVTLEPREKTAGT